MAKVTQRILSDKVLDKTMQLFWKNGFFNTSIEDIIEVTGFNRAAIYRNFGGKNELFLSMLQRYQEQITDVVTSPLKDKNLGIEGIKTFFSQFITLHNHPHLSNGCFLIATASDFPSHNKKIVAFIQKFLSYLQDLFRNALKNAKKKYELKENIDINSAADFLMGNLFGFWTLRRSQASKKLLSNHINKTIDFLTQISNVK